MQYWVVFPSEVFCEESFCFIHDDHATTNFMLYSGNHFLFPVGDVQAVENISMFFVRNLCLNT